MGTNTSDSAAALRLPTFFEDGIYCGVLGELCSA
jgi:hypothetical protein